MGMEVELLSPGMQCSSKIKARYENTIRSTQRDAFPRLSDGSLYRTLVDMIKETLVLVAVGELQQIAIERRAKVGR